MKLLDFLIEIKVPVKRDLKVKVSSQDTRDDGSLQATFAFNVVEKLSEKAQKESDARVIQKIKPLFAQERNTIKAQREHDKEFAVKKAVEMGLSKREALDIFKEHYFVELDDLR
jgi:hypothetical protein